MIVGGNWTWESAFIINSDGETAAIVGSIEEENIKRTGTFKNIMGYLKSIREPLRNTLRKRIRKISQLIISKNSVLADGLTHGMYNILMEHLKGSGYENRLVFGGGNYFCIQRTEIADRT